LVAINNSLYFCFCFSLVFGPKFGVLDTSILFPVLLLPFILISLRKMPSVFDSIAVMIILMLAYQSFIQIINQNFEFEAVGRLLRALMNVLIVGAIFNKKSLNLKQKIYRALLLAITFHALIVIVSGLFYPVNEFFSNISGNIKIKEFRASGLMAGFDISGFLSIIGMAMIIFRIYPFTSNLFEMLLLITLLSSTYFSSRVSMAISILLFLFYIFRFFGRQDVYLKYRFFSFFILAFVAYYFAYNLLLILNVTLSLGIFDVDASFARSILLRHAAQAKDVFLWENMFFLPNSWMKIIFGTGKNVLQSDVGYVKEIFRYGIIGLICSIFIHVYYVLKILNKDTKNDINRMGFILFVTIMIFILSLKNNYFFVRGVFPTYLILTAAVIRDEHSDQNQ
jgi:hypothetical protein